MVVVVLLVRPAAESAAAQSVKRVKGEEERGTWAVFICFTNGCLECFVMG
jgi:hypothetical protein